MVDAVVLQDALREALREEFAQLTLELLQSVRAASQSGCRSEAGELPVLSPRGALQQVPVCDPSAPVHAGPSSLPSPAHKLLVPMHSKSSGRNFMPLRTFKATEYMRFVCSLDTPERKRPQARRLKSWASDGRAPAEEPPQLLAEGRAEGAPGLLVHGMGQSTTEPTAGRIHPFAPEDEPSTGSPGGAPKLAPPVASSASQRRSSAADVAMGFAPKATGSFDGLATPRQLRAESLVRSVGFELLSMAVIFCSAAVTGVQTDYMARHGLATSPGAFRAFDMAFLVYFTLEVALRLFAYRGRYFRMWGWGWNVLDVFLVSTQIMEEVLLAILSASVRKGLPSRVLLRIIRILRSVRVIRAFHVMSFAGELRVFAACIVHSLRAFVWAAAMILLIIYVFGVYFTQVALFWRLDAVNAVSTSKELSYWYGNLPRAVLSLFQGLTGGVDWNDLVDPLMRDISPWMGVLFFLYTSFATLAVMNVVTAMFVQQAIERAAQVQDVQKLSQASRLFMALDVDRSGFITFQEIEKHLESKEVREFFQSIDVDLGEARCLFDMLDTDNSGSLAFDDFLSGCLRLQGPAKAADLVLVMRELKQVLQK